MTAALQRCNAKNADFSILYMLVVSKNFRPYIDRDDKYVVKSDFLVLFEGFLPVCRTLSVKHTKTQQLTTFASDIQKSWVYT